MARPAPPITLALGLDRIDLHPRACPLGHCALLFDSELALQDHVWSRHRSPFTLLPDPCPNHTRIPQKSEQCMRIHRFFVDKAYDEYIQDIKIQIPEFDLPLFVTNKWMAEDLQLRPVYDDRYIRLEMDGFAWISKGSAVHSGQYQMTCAASVRCDTDLVVIGPHTDSDIRPLLSCRSRASHTHPPTFNLDEMKRVNCVRRTFGTENTRRGDYISILGDTRHNLYEATVLGDYVHPGSPSPRKYTFFKCVVSSCPKGLFASLGTGMPDYEYYEYVGSDHRHYSTGIVPTGVTLDLFGHPPPSPKRPCLRAISPPPIPSVTETPMGVPGHPGVLNEKTDLNLFVRYFQTVCAQSPEPKPNVLSLITQACETVVLYRKVNRRPPSLPVPLAYFPGRHYWSGSQFLRQDKPAKLVPLCADLTCLLMCLRGVSSCKRCLRAPGVVLIVETLRDTRRTALLTEDQLKRKARLIYVVSSKQALTTGPTLVKIPGGLNYYPVVLPIYESNVNDDDDDEETGSQYKILAYKEFSADEFPKQSLNWITAAKLYVYFAQYSMSDPSYAGKPIVLGNRSISPVEMEGWSELQALCDYNKSVICFESAEEAGTRGSSRTVQDIQEEIDRVSTTGLPHESEESPGVTFLNSLELVRCSPDHGVLYFIRLGRFGYVGQSTSRSSKEIARVSPAHYAKNDGTAFGQMMARVGLSENISYRSLFAVTKKPHLLSFEVSAALALFLGFQSGEKYNGPPPYIPIQHIANLQFNFPSDQFNLPRAMNGMAMYFFGKRFIAHIDQDHLIPQFPPKRGTKSDSDESL